MGQGQLRRISELRSCAKRVLKVGDADGDPALRLKGEGRWKSYPGSSANGAHRPQLSGSGAATRAALPPDPLFDAFPSPGGAHCEAVTWSGDDRKPLSLAP